MADPSKLVQEAFIARYRGDATLQGLMSGASAPEWRIFDQGGSGTVDPLFPVIFVQPITGVRGAALAFGSDSMNLFIQVRVDTKTDGFWQARAIIARIYALTHGPAGASPFSVPGFANPLSLFDNRQELEETADIATQHIVDRYLFVAQG